MTGLELVIFGNWKTGNQVIRIGSDWKRINGQYVDSRDVGRTESQKREQIIRDRRREAESRKPRELLRLFEIEGIPIFSRQVVNFEGKRSGRTFKIEVNGN
jgi:hypothetical protein